MDLDLVSVGLGTLSTCVGFCLYQLFRTPSAQERLEYEKREYAARALRQAEADLAQLGYTDAEQIVADLRDRWS